MMEFISTGEVQIVDIQMRPLQDRFDVIAHGRLRLTFEAFGQRWVVEIDNAEIKGDGRMWYR